jgi:hypothetical protein
LFAALARAKSGSPCCQYEVFVYAIFAISWIGSAAIYRLNGYHRLEAQI